MSERDRDYPRRVEKGIGCGTLIGIPVCVVLALLGYAAGGGCTVEIPATNWNISWAGSIGDKNNTIEALPGYMETTPGKSDNFLNSSADFNIGPFGIRQVFVIGGQPDAPVIGIDLNLDH